MLEKVEKYNLDRVQNYAPNTLHIVVRFVPLVINHNLGYRIWPSLAQHSITQVMIYNLGYDL